MKLKKLLRVLSAWTAAAIAAGSIAVSSTAAADEADAALGSLEIADALRANVSLSLSIAVFSSRLKTIMEE